jgi:flagellar biosynthesis/type III secretory pathway protein FliH
VQDASIAPGGCRILTRQGRVEAELETQLDHIVADLLPGAPAPASPGGHRPPQSMPS